MSSVLLSADSFKKSFYQLTNSVDSDQTALVGAVLSGSTKFASILKLGNIVSK